MTTELQPGPPSPPPQPPSGLDFARSFTFVFEDPEWIRKILIGGLFYLAGFVLIGYVFLLGYLARLVRNVVAGLERPLPDWTDLGEYFGEGLKLLAVGFLYVLPIFALIVAFGVPSAVLGGVWDEGVGEALFSTVLCFTVPLGFLVMLVLPAALLRVITLERFSAAFEFQQIYDFIRRNFVNYLLAMATYLVANFAAQFGVILCCIGVIFTGFWSLVVTMYGFAQVCRLDSR